MGSGLEKKTTDTYKNEWRLYQAFCRREGIVKVPGKDTKWVIDVIARYLWWRSRRSGSLAQIKCRLKHCGLCYNHLLPTARGEGPATLRLQLAMVTAVILKKRKKAMKAAGKSTAVKRSLALGRVAVGMLFSAYGATSKKGFAMLPDNIQAMLSRCPSMHTGCMRFGLLKDLWKQARLRWSDIDKTHRMASDWTKMKRAGSFTIPFPAEPSFSAMRYPMYSKTGVETGSFTAADVLSWRVNTTGSRNARRLFGSRHSGRPDRGAFQWFLRTSFRRLLIGKSQEVEALVRAITPHSFRAGMASDLHRQGVAIKVIMKLGRWYSERAMRQYVRDGLGQRLSNARFLPLQAKASDISALLRAHQTTGDICAYFSGSSDYDEDEE